jgi:DNA-directed RNA polymerase specialized sigma24 family protein
VSSGPVTAHDERSFVISNVVSLKPGQQLEELADPTVDVAEEACLKAEADPFTVRRRLGLLDQPDRAVIEWRFGIRRPQLNHREIAARLGVSVGTVWTIEQRALARLRSEFGFEEAA